MFCRYLFNMKDIIRKVLRENEFSDKKKQLIFKLWDREKMAGKPPQVNSALAKSIGHHNIGILESWLLEWYGGYKRIEEMMRNEFLDKTLSISDMSEKYGVMIGSYDFKFKITNLKIIEEPVNEDYICYTDFEIPEGIVDAFDGNTYDLTKLGELNDDLEWEITLEIKDVINALCVSFGMRYGLIFSETSSMWV